MRIYYFLFLLIGIPVLLSAQHPAMRSMRAALKEKVKITDLQSWFEAQQSRGAVEDSLAWTNVETRSSTFGELRIGNTQKPESEIHAAIDPADSNRMMVAVMRHDPFVSSPLSFSFYGTENFGQNWFQSPFRGTDTGNSAVAGGGDPVLVYDSNGKVHLVWLLLTFNGSTQNGKVGFYYASTENQGLNWSQAPNNPRIFGNLIVPAGSNDIVATDKFVDKPWLAIDQTSGIFRDQLYMIYYELQLMPDTVPTIQCARKSRTGTNFGTSTVQVNSQQYVDLQFSSVDIDDAGVVHVSFFATLDGTHYALYHASSSNGGTSFDPETKIADVGFPAPTTLGSFPSSIEGIDRLYPCPHIQVDNSESPFNGYLYATWTAQGVGQGNNTEGFDIYFSRSTDGGNSWSYPAIVNNDMDSKTHQFYSSIDVTPKGIIVLSWYDRRDDPNNLDTHYYMAYSADGGVTFEDQFVVSGQSSDFSKIGNTNEDFGIGEYTQIISSPGHAIPFWADGRGNNGEVKVYTGFVPLDAKAMVGMDRWSSLSDILEVFEVFPNPTVDKLAIDWTMTATEDVGLSLLDMQGKEVRKIQFGRMKAGEHQYTLDLQSLAAGTYVLLLEAGEAMAGRRILLEKQ
ncbi:MAG: T9SS type A sorting domain-containing protein [Bacteroidota bacterium]